jgi:protein tyrosine/serine phosphatase
MKTKRFPYAFAVLTFVLSLSFSAAAQQPQTADFSNVKIKNFGQMDDNFYRGAQPKEKDYAQLAALGIKTVIDLRNDPKDYAKASAEASGLQYVNIPMSDKDYPKSEQIQQFLDLVKNDSTGKFYVHCAGGRHRTGVMGAVYRFNNYSWDYTKVYAEMKQYDFYTRWGHGDMKKFVQDYAVKFKESSEQKVAAEQVVKEK